MVVLHRELEERFNALNAIEMFFEIIFGEMVDQSFSRFAELASRQFDFSLQPLQFQLQLVKWSADGTKGLHRFFPVLVVDMAVQLRQNYLRGGKLIEEILLVVAGILDIIDIIDDSFRVLQKEADDYVRSRKRKHSAMPVMLIDLGAITNHTY